MSVSRGVNSTPKALQVMLLILSVVLFLLVCAWAVLGFVVPALRPPKLGLVTPVPGATQTAVATQTVAPAETTLPATPAEALPAQTMTSEITPGAVELSATPLVLATPTRAAPIVSPSVPAISATPTTLAEVIATSQLPPTEDLSTRTTTVTAQRVPLTAPASPTISPTPTGIPAVVRATRPVTEMPEMAGAISETTILVTPTLLTQTPTAATRLAEPSATTTPAPTGTATSRPTMLPSPSPLPKPSDTPTATATVEPTPTPAMPASPTATPTPEPSVLASPTPLATLPAPTLPPQPAPPGVQPGNLIVNGDFEQGLQSTGVAVGWQSFNNAGAEFSFQPRDWEVLTLDGQHSQFMRIRKAQQPDRYLGIYQTVFVVPGKTYTFSIEGVVRSDIGDVNLSQYGYRLQVGFDLQGAQAWKAVDNWIELPWDEQPRQPQALRTDRFSTQVTPVGDKLTIFVRAWKKWADEYEGAYTIDNIRLEGPAPGTLPQPQARGAQPEMGQAGRSAAEAEMPAQALLSANVAAPAEMPGSLTAVTRRGEAPEVGPMVAPAEVEAQTLAETPSFAVVNPRQPGASVSIPAPSEVQAPAQPQLEARPVPVTGDSPPQRVWYSARVYTTIALLLILIVSASWRMLWTRT